MMYRWLLIGATVGLCLTQGNAQETDSARDENPRFARLRVLARADRDSIVLRWAPARAGGWVIANRLGYHVERIRINTDRKSPPGAPERLSIAPIVPWKLDEWRTRTRPDQTLAAVAAQVLYGKVSIPKATEQKHLNALQRAADELSDRYSFALFAADCDPFAATGLGLRLVDHNVKEGDRFLYRVFVAGHDSTYSFDTAYVLVDVKAYSPAPAPPGLTAEGMDGLITLHWKNHPASPYSAYIVERSNDNGTTYTRLTKTPFVVLTPDNAKATPTPRYDDTTVVNYKSYRYRVRGITPFGDFSEGAHVDMYARDVTPPRVPFVQNPKQVGTNRVRVTWRVDSVDGDLAGFVIARNPTGSGEFRLLTERSLPKSAREFVDDSATEDEPYYIVGAVDTAGNVARSVPVYATIVDSTPPHVPTGLTGTIDSNGVVHLRWNLNVERHLQGYRVLWANDPRHEFTQRTPFPIDDTTFTDTVNVKTMTEYVYYRIAAVSSRFVHSEPSPMLALRRPDKLPPEPSVFTDVRVNDSTVALSWATSTSEDLASQVVSRRKMGEPAWEDLATLGRTANDYVDSAITKNVMYEYRLTAIDSSGLRATSPYTVQGRPYDTGVRPPATRVTGVYDSARHRIRVRWDYTQRKEKMWFVIYRGVGGRQVTTYRSVDAAARTYEDADLVGAGTYEYAVRVATALGESPLSGHVKVEVR